MSDDADDQRLTPAEPGYLTVLRLHWLALMLPLCIGGALVDWFVIRPLGWGWGLLTVAPLMLTLLLMTVTATRQFAHRGHALDADSLRVVRGHLFHTDTIVPFVRVQHIDVGQGPVERLCGVAHLVVHTAGTHNSIVTLPGLRPDSADAIRDTIRRHIQSDFA
jgi:hypothetical protein